MIKTTEHNNVYIVRDKICVHTPFIFKSRIVLEKNNKQGFESCVLFQHNSVKDTSLSNY